MIFLTGSGLVWTSHLTEQDSDGTELNPMAMAPNGTLPSWELKLFARRFSNMDIFLLNS